MKRRSQARIKFDEVMDPRQIAVGSLELVVGEGRQIHQVLTRLRNGSPASRNDLKLAECWIKGVAEYLAAIDKLLKGALNAGELAKLPVRIQMVLRIAVFQIRYLDRVVPARVVSESVELSKKYGPPALVRLVNGVLRRIVRESSQQIGAHDNSVAGIAEEFSHPEWLVARWVNEFGVEVTRELAQANNQRWPLGIRANTTRCTVETLIKKLAADGVKAKKGRWARDFLVVTELSARKRLDQLASFKEGLFFVQDEGSALVAELVAPKAGEMVVDLAAAPGGKSMALACLMGDRDGGVVAVDVSPPRVRLIRENLNRLGLKIVAPRIGNGSTIQLERLADRVLVDAPCSGTGTLGRKVDLRWKRKEQDIEAILPVQASLLDNAAKLVKVGGRLVYSTCSLEAEENRGQVESFLERHRNFRLEKPNLAQQLLSSDGRFLQTLPSQHNGAGLFAASLVRVT